MVFQTPRTAGAALDPMGSWLASGSGGSVSLWPLDGARAFIIDTTITQDLAFTPDGQWLAAVRRSAVGGSELVLLPLSGETAVEPRILLRWRNGLMNVAAFDRHGGRVLVAGDGGRVQLLAPESGAIRRLEGFDEDSTIFSAALDPSGRYAAASAEKVIRVWDLEDDTVRLLEPEPLAERAGLPVPVLDTRGRDRTGVVRFLRFAPDGQLYSGGYGPLVRWHPATGSGEILRSEVTMVGDLSTDGRFFAAAGSAHGSDLSKTELVVMHLDRGTKRTITTHRGIGRGRLARVLLDPSANALITTEDDSIIRVGSVAGDEPHMLLGHDDRVRALAVSSDGRWLASATDTEIRIWPMPDIEKPPFHALPLDDMVAKLDSLTNVRVVRDLESATGRRLEIGPFPGWATVPSW
jgi:WD40 repeat protein